ncbi:uncharacterized protein LOC142881138 [Nelusetta ayraudi]|uniref:uncharacterized protein LOC142881138 n=1 Tax=Nelusetta ayraudi TaxID=303726 RepID=UPI003F6F3BC6
MTAHILLVLALCFTRASSQGGRTDGRTDNRTSCEKLGPCESHDLWVRPGSSVLLPCNLSASAPLGVSWVQIRQSFLVQLTPGGHVKFVEPRQGRVTVFPNGASGGNFSIRLDRVQPSDLDSYCCQSARHCVQVNLLRRGLQVKTQLMWVSACVAPVVFVLLLVGYFRCTRHSRQGAAVKETHGQPTQESQTGADNLVYENDSHCPAYRQAAAMANRSSGPAGATVTGPPAHRGTGGAAPNQNQVNRDRMESQRRRWRFHTEMFNRLRPASFSRHFYVNQAELSHSSKQDTQRSQQADLKYNNPVYAWDPEAPSQQ